MRRRATDGDYLQHPETGKGPRGPGAAMETVEIDGRVYVPATAVAEEVGVCRQTLWRWRRRGKIPYGHRHRNGQVLFTPEEAEEVCGYANQVDPIAAPAAAREQASATGPTGGK